LAVHVVGVDEVPNRGGKPRREGSKFTQQRGVKIQTALTGAAPVELGELFAAAFFRWPGQGEAFVEVFPRKYW
jgi:hypothetical protein